MQLEMQVASAEGTVDVLGWRAVGRVVKAGVNDEG